MKKTTVRLNKNLVFIAGTIHFLPEIPAIASLSDSKISAGNFGNISALKARKRLNQENDSLRGPALKKSPELSKTPAKMPEFPFHPYSALAEIVAQRLENPVNRRFLNGEIKRAKGSNGKKSILKNDGKLHGCAIRSLSKFDREEIRGEIALILAEKPDGEKLTFENWKAIFSAARKTLRINRRLERENLLSSLEELQSVDFHSDLTANSALLAFREKEKSEIESTDNFCNGIFSGEIRELIRAILAANREEISNEKRKAKSNKKIALQFLRKSAASFRGEGHGEATRKIHRGGIDLHKLREAQTTFGKYILLGQCRLNLEKAAFEKAVTDYNENLSLYAIGE
jgi:hypothetical protein